MIESIFAFAGGIGLLLLGMHQLSDGLKVAAGNALRQLLEAATKNRTRGILSGVAITTVVQSSSAVVFATIGFVNAGLLTLYQAIGIIFGSNLGTTLTSWLVALVGFNVDLQALAMPAIGVGMAMSVMFRNSRRGALGQALAGFGLFFLGVDILKSAFEGVGDPALLAQWTGYGVMSTLLFIFIGTMLTVITQSSSAALAITLTAAAGGLVPYSAAAAMVIGANVGTTSTAALAVIGATSAAKRAAAAHVSFNVITGLVAFSLLPILLWLVELISQLLGTTEQVAISLAIFHTMTKLLGLLIMVPATGILVEQLEKRFQRPEEDLAKPRYLDKNVLATPSLALDALARELQRMGTLAHELFIQALSREQGCDPRMESTFVALDHLGDSISEFTASVYSTLSDEEMLSALPNSFRVAQHYHYVGERAIELAKMSDQVNIDNDELEAAVSELKSAAIHLLNAADSTAENWSPEQLDEYRKTFKQVYDETKKKLLRAGTMGQIRARSLVTVLEYLSVIRRAMRDSAKAARDMNSLLHRQKIVAEVDGEDMGE